MFGVEVTSRFCPLMGREISNPVWCDSILVERSIMNLNEDISIPIKGIVITKIVGSSNAVTQSSTSNIHSTLLANITEILKLNCKTSPPIDSQII
jgi:hypothetical protein